jgi:hypothetical protein
MQGLGLPFYRAQAFLSSPGLAFLPALIIRRGFEPPGGNAAWWVRWLVPTTCSFRFKTDGAIRRFALGGLLRSGGRPLETVAKCPN